MTGQKIYELRKKIQKQASELALLNVSVPEIPELINSTNLLRSNEILLATNSKKSEIISSYEEYSKELESLLKTAFEIQSDLAGILKMQTSLIPKKKPSRKKASPKTKSKK